MAITRILPEVLGRSVAIRNCLALKQRPKKLDLLKFLTAVGNEINESVGDNARAGNRSIIAWKIVVVHPTSFADNVDEIGAIGNGSHKCDTALFDMFRMNGVRKDALWRKLI